MKNLLIIITLRKTIFFAESKSIEVLIIEFCRVEWIPKIRAFDILMSLHKLSASFCSELRWGKF